MRGDFIVFVVCFGWLQVVAATRADATEKEWKDYSVGLIGERPDAPPLYNFNAHRLRNHRITRAYADMYLSNPEAFKWAGLAATVSREIGSRIALAARSHSLAANIFYDIARKAGWLPPDVDVVLLGSVTGHSLGSGNYFVFKDLYWQHLVARECGIDALGRYMLPTSQGWGEIQAGIAKKDQNKVWDGNRKLLMHEQSSILQKYVYGVDQALWAQLSQIDRSEFPLFVSPSGVRFAEIVKPYGEFGVFADRWKWIEQAVVNPAQRLDSVDTISGPGRGKSMVDTVQKVLVGEIEEILRLESSNPHLRLKAVQKPACPSLSTTAP